MGRQIALKVLCCFKIVVGILMATTAVLAIITISLTMYPKTANPILIVGWAIKASLPFLIMFAIGISFLFPISDRLFLFTPDSLKEK